MNLLVTVRKSPVGRRVPILILGEPRTTDEHAATAAAGVHWFARKGFRVETLVEEVRALVRQAQQPAVAEEQPNAGQIKPLTEEAVWNALSADGAPSPFEFSLVEMATTTSTRGHEIDHMVELAEHDPLFALAMLAWANNPQTGPKGRFSELCGASKCLGPRQIYRLSESLSPLRCDNASLWDPGFFWIHSVTTGRIAKMLSKRMGLAMPEEAMAAGLFAGLGYFVLARHFPQHFGALMRAGWNTDSVSCAWEESITGVHHGRLASWFLTHLNTAPSLQEAIEFHHLSDSENSSIRNSSRVLAMIIQAAEQIADALFPGDPPLAPLAPLSKRFLVAIRDAGIPSGRIATEAGHIAADLITEMLHFFPQSENRSAYYRHKPLGTVGYWIPDRPYLDIVRMFLDARCQHVVETDRIKDLALRDYSAAVINLAHLEDATAASEAISTLLARGWLQGRKTVILLNEALPENCRGLAPDTCRFAVTPAHPAHWLRWLAEPVAPRTPAARPQLRIA
jgi:HD-like signal output (HDOD) protein